jgi:hypothetical protein
MPSTSTSTRTEAHAQRGAGHVMRALVPAAIDAWRTKRCSLLAALRLRNDATSVRAAHADAW